LRVIALGALKFKSSWCRTKWRYAQTEASPDELAGPCWTKLVVSLGGLGCCHYTALALACSFAALFAVYAICVPRTCALYTLQSTQFRQDCQQLEADGLSVEIAAQQARCYLVKQDMLQL
jgi:hypothetical protein